MKLKLLLAGISLLGANAGATECDNANSYSIVSGLIEENDIPLRAFLNVATALEGERDNKLANETDKLTANNGSLNVTHNTELNISINKNDKVATKKAEYPVFDSSLLERSELAPIQYFFIYPDVGEGNLVIRLSEPSSICHGYWLPSNSQGYQANVDILLSAFNQGKKVLVTGHTDNASKWPNGDADTHLCKIHSVGLSR